MSTRVFILSFCSCVSNFNVSHIIVFFVLMIRRPPRSTQSRSSAASDVYKRQGLNAEKDAMREIGEEHIHEAYKISRFLHLKYSIHALRREEKDLLRLLVNLSRKDEQLTSGQVYTIVKKKLKLGYTIYYEALRKLDTLRLINLEFRDGRGRTRLINLRYDPDKILFYL